MSDDRKREFTVMTIKDAQVTLPSQKGIQTAVKPGPVERMDVKPVERKG